MKTSVLIIVFVLIGMSTGHTQQVRKPAPAAVAQRKVDTLFPKEVVKFLGDRVVDVIQNADSVNAFVLDPQSNKAPQLGGFTILRNPVLLSNQQSQQLCQILTQEKHWVLDKTDKLCPFVPSLGFEFVRQGGRVTVLVCLECNMWRFIHSSVVKTEDCDPAHQVLIRFAKTIFPNEIVFKNL